MVKGLNSVSNLAPARACSALLLCLCPIGAAARGHGASGKPDALIAFVSKQ